MSKTGKPPGRPGPKRQLDFDTPPDVFRVVRQDGLLDGLQDGLLDERKVEAGLRKLRNLDAHPGYTRGSPPPYTMLWPKMPVDSPLAPIASAEGQTQDGPVGLGARALGSASVSGSIEATVVRVSDHDAGKEEVVARLRGNMLLVRERTQAIQQSQEAFRWNGVLLPKRIRDEEIGDAIEDLQRIINDPTIPNVRRAVRWKIISTWFWLIVHAVGRITAAIFGKKAS